MDLEKVVAKDIMSTDVVTFDENQSLNLVELVAEAKHVRHVPIVNSERHPVGVLGIRDFLRHFSTPGSSHFIPIKDIIERKVVSCYPTDSLQSVANKMYENEVSAVVVIEDQKIVGILTEHDFLLALLGKK
ncbi:MAG: CBS domain-containing protein [Bdellovibrionales bacterium]|nr:CBS domain-containing protein [Bdellovibrionales bacterium]